MAQTQTIQASQSNPDPRIPLTPDEEWALVAHVQARTQLLEHKKEGLTMDEKRICHRGERALRLLVQDCHRLIWWHVNRSNFSYRIPKEEMYQIGLMCVDLAANSHNPNKPGKQRSFKSWVSLKLRSRLINRFDTEFRYHRRGKAYCDQQIHNNDISNGYTPLKLAFYQALREKLEQIIQTSLIGKKAEVFRAYYLQNEESKQIADSLGLKVETVWKYNQLSRRTAPRKPTTPRVGRVVLNIIPAPRLSRIAQTGRHRFFQGEKAMNTSSQFDDCMYFNSLHQCCSVRLEESNLPIYLRREPTSEACKDFNVPDLLEFFQTPRTRKELAMIDNDDRDWQGVPVLQVCVQSGGLRIVGTVDGLTDLLTAIAKAMDKGNSSVELLSSESDVYPVMVERRDLASEWNNLPPPILDPKQIDDQPIDDSDLDGLDFREIF